MSFRSRIIISAEFEEIRSELLGEFSRANLRFIPDEPAQDFLIEHAREAHRQAYIAEDEEKILVLMAHSFGIEAQNLLLKILEEPPPRIKFLLVVPSKNLLLPTIRSRLPLEKRAPSQPPPPLGLDLKKLDFEAIFDFLAANENAPKNEVLAKLSQLSQQALRQDGHRMSQEELELFFTAYELARVNARPGLIFAALLLNLK